MKKVSFGLSLVAITTLFTGCTAVGDIFKAGMWTSVIIIVIIVVIVLFIISKFSGKK